MELPAELPDLPVRAVLDEVMAALDGSGTAVLVAEVVYNYQPIVSDAIFGARIIRYESAFNVRQRNDQALKNAGHITPRSCNTFAA